MQNPGELDSGPRAQNVCKDAYARIIETELLNCVGPQGLREEGCYQWDILNMKELLPCLLVILLPS